MSDDIQNAHEYLENLRKQKTGIQLKFGSLLEYLDIKAKDKGIPMRPLAEGIWRSCRRERFYLQRFQLR